jgi:hypothetical protein
MRNLLIPLSFLYISLPLLATTQDCYRLDETEVRNKCMQFESDQAVGRLMTKLSDKCEGTEEFKFHECLAKNLDELTKKVRELD